MRYFVCKKVIKSQFKGASFTCGNSVKLTVSNSSKILEVSSFLNFQSIPCNRKLASLSLTFQHWVQKSHYISKCCFNLFFIYLSVKSSMWILVIVATEPRCYNPSDPELNSTAWFAEYIGLFMPFLTLEDLQTFGSAQVPNLIWEILKWSPGCVQIKMKK